MQIEDLSFSQLKSVYMATFQPNYFGPHQANEIQTHCNTFIFTTNVFLKISTSHDTSECLVYENSNITNNGKCKSRAFHGKHTASEYKRVVFFLDQDQRSLVE